ncbi:hypothetical protein Q8F55_008474 [Vanrija albida]|uniref:Uncharacterized protein n=1 Tax=Vanrija albida TaxID=181172 RepID=A0ABR3PQY2_9TREE
MTTTYYDSKDELRRHHHDQYNPPRQSYAPDLPPAYAPPRPASSYAPPQPPRPVPDAGSAHAQAKAAYDNPLASNDAWAPTAADYALRALPKLDFMLRVKSRLSRTAGQPFATEPRSWRRAPPQHSNPPFDPLILHPEGRDGLIGAGFEPAYFGPVLAAHDVSAADMSRFLEDIFTAGKVSAGGQVLANVAPVTMHMGITGYFVTKAIVRGMARRNEPLVVETIEAWQARFFGPRGLDVFVVQGGERATARDVGLPPGPVGPEVARLTGERGEDRRRSRSNSSSSSSSDSEPERRGNMSKKEARLQREIDKERRKREKKERKEEKKRRHDEEKRDRKGRDKGKKAKGPWLVIAPLAAGPGYGAQGYGGVYGRV